MFSKKNTISGYKGKPIPVNNWASGSFSSTSIKKISSKNPLNNLVSVQHLKAPNGNIFYLDFVYGHKSFYQQIAEEVLDNMNKIEEILYKDYFDNIREKIINATGIPKQFLCEPEVKSCIAKSLL